ncbi:MULTISPECIES: ABC transporter permease [Vagococcus]|uniref:ABC transporter permease protein YvcS n=1 Tax=Vagococcus fluvialis bH819 TaxID=1255619 RepID=A0A1X6WQW1_9ENTE|nr:MULTISPECIES: ABC transporter permease [Vagococcus]SLM86670.1 ABC transporter permease protein YvcS [Vagococcus fluvialis bH819]HCM90878.1 ABC transporter permease [Vagococcus sp.]
MRFKEFVFKNTIRNKNLYMAYFFSTLTTVMTFFTFAVFAFHPKLNGDLHMAVKAGMITSSVIIYIFSFFYVLYSMDIFLQSRKKEFGLLLIQGMSPKQLRKMVFQENTIIGFLSTVVGTLVGILFSQLILWLSKVTMHVDLGFYFPIKAIGMTFVSFILLFMIISFFIQFKIPKMDVQELLKSQDMGKGEVKASTIKSILSIVLIGVGYAVALMVEGMQVVMAMIPVIILVILGTNFLFNQLSVLAVNGLKRNENRFWKKTNMLVFSDLSFRMKDNARSFFLVAVITTVAFSAIGTLTGFKEMTLSGIKSMPYDYSFTENPEKADESQNKVAIVNETLKKHDIQADEYQVTPLTVSNALGTETTTNVLNVKQYNEIAKKIGEKELRLDDQSTVSLKDLSAPEMMTGQKSELPTEFNVSETEKLAIKQEEVKQAVWPTYSGTYIVSEAIYEKLKEKNTSTTMYAWLVNKGSFDQQKVAGDELGKNKTIGMIDAKASTTQMITDAYAPILFIGFFIGIIFFISAGSFLYFRLYSDMSVDIEKFSMIHKLGFSKKEMKKVVYQQVGILFFTPIVVSCIHGAVALTAMYALFGKGLQITALYVLGTFIVIQVVYYLIARVFYFKKLYRAVIN